MIAKLTRGASKVTASVSRKMSMFLAMKALVAFLRARQEVLDWASKLECSGDSYDEKEIGQAIRGLVQASGGDNFNPWEVLSALDKTPCAYTRARRLKVFSDQYS